MNRVLSAIILLIVCHSCKKEATEISIINHYEQLSKNQLLEDFNLFQSIYQDANAGLYKYHPKAKIDSLFLSTKQKITTNTSYRDFYNILWDVIDFTGSCHNELTYPNVLDSVLSNQKIFFPIPIKYIQGKLYTNGIYKDIPLGSEIMAVNTIKALDFISKVARYTSTDGFNMSGKYAFLNTSFMPFYTYLALGPQDEFKIKFKTQNRIKETLVTSNTYNHFSANYSQRYSKKHEQRKKQDYTYKYIDSLKSGYLSVKTFAMGGPKSEGHKKYATFLDSVFSNLKTQKITKLIVDVRGNGGGNDPNDLLLYSYLTSRNFRENTSAYTLFQNIPFSEYYIDDDIDQLPIDLKKEHSIFKDDRYYQNTTNNKQWAPKTNAFQGDLIVLIDPFVASAGSLFASLVKSDAKPVLIGEETLGGYYGHTGHIPVNYQLPNSKLTLTFSIVDLEQDVTELPDQKYGDGVKPDFKVSQSYSDFMQNVDTQLNVALEVITAL